MYRLRRMARLVRGRVLDIGFADQPNPHLHGEVYGFDRQAVPTPANYRDVIIGDVRHLADIEMRFDAILAGEIIEHLIAPMDFLADCYHLLRPGGQLVLSTPNPYYPPVVWLERLMIRRFFYSPGHINLFLPRFLVRLLEQNGFEEVEVHSGGIPLPGFDIGLPFPRPYCYALIYVGGKP